ncbi:hypothetical protein MFM001_17880 [Mycobacterium sp. MFM001]|uniref:DUF2599 domain-containing protein n=1 Tax=Mycobacterium sp. MFM001 TaxID=2049453 RepID=UPI000DA5B03C|nr:DUF2599 domain-containing protein [Mycobacterium sp. MFM001]GBE65326.1 hypothetical protein MFM001_17880 [Mycobacterium sp. MFM001]
MRSFAVLAVAFFALLGAAPASAETATPPFVDHTEWVQWGSGTSLRVYPTPSARAAARQGVSGSDEAWSEVLAKAPGADTPGMRAQFLCHWEMAEFAEPGKTSWNLEPWRPVVDDATMLASGCNPGGAEEPF